MGLENYIAQENKANANRKPNDGPKVGYRKNLERALIVSLSSTILLFAGFKRAPRDYNLKVLSLDTIQLEEIPQTYQMRKQRAPERPSVPIEADEDEKLPDDTTIETTELNLDYIPPPPPPPPESGNKYAVPTFIAHDEPPQPIGGYDAIKKYIVYPEIARKAGIEGRVYIQALVDERGTVERTVVTKSLGPNGCDQAAIDAIMKVKWEPAYQRDKAVKVWVMIPIDFRLK